MHVYFSQKSNNHRVSIFEQHLFENTYIITSILDTLIIIKLAIKCFFVIYTFKNSFTD